MLESEIQKQVIRYCRSVHKNDFFVFSVANETLFKAFRFIPEKIRRAIYSKLVAMGFVTGFPDLVFIKEGEVILIELKNETGKLSSNQKSVFPLIEKFSGRIETARSLEDVLIILKEWDFI